jgi:hypothetical protein
MEPRRTTPLEKCGHANMQKQKNYLLLFSSLLLRRVYSKDKCFAQNLGGERTKRARGTKEIA